MGSNRTLTVIEAAKELGLTRAAVYQAIERGDLKARKKIVQKIEIRIPLSAVRSYKVNTTQQANSRNKD